jgi:hypothetical protein
MNLFQKMLLCSVPMLAIIILNYFQSVLCLSVIMLNVVAPIKTKIKRTKKLINGPRAVLKVNFLLLSAIKTLLIFDCFNEECIISLSTATFCCRNCDTVKKSFSTETQPWKMSKLRPSFELCVGIFIARWGTVWGREHWLKGSLSTADLLIKLARLAKNWLMFALSKAADLTACWGQKFLDQALPWSWP